MDKTSRRYEPAGPTIKAFHESPAFVRGLMGPFSSGKSVACVIEILRRAKLQHPGPDGKRRTRWAVIRNTYGELRTTTLNTWTGWVPKEYGKVNMDSPFAHIIKYDDVEIEVLFLALDKEEDTRKLLSLELTGAWINEAREVGKSVLDVLTGRVGRYPAKFQGGCSWRGIIMDTNPPDSESWWFKAAEVDTPQGWEFFRQPSGLSPQAENIPNIDQGVEYYRRQLHGKTEDFVKVHIHGEYGFVMTGKPVYPMYSDSTYTARENLEPVKDIPLTIGVDFGIMACAVIGQLLPNGRWLILDEFFPESPGLVNFAESLVKYIRQNYEDFDVEGCWADPAGEARFQNDGSTGFQVLNEYTPWTWKPAPTNEIDMRLEVVMNALRRLIDGLPGILISPKCAKLRKGFNGGYQYKLIKNTDGKQTQETPMKNDFSHIQDATQYMLLGGGEHEVVLRKVKRHRGGGNRRGPVHGTDYDVFGD